MELSNQVSSPGRSRWQLLKMEPLGEVSSMVKHCKIIPDASHTLYIFVMLLTKDNALGTIFLD